MSDALSSAAALPLTHIAYWIAVLAALYLTRALVRPHRGSAWWAADSRCDARRGAQCGISLLELLVGIQLFGIVALATAPAVSQMLQAYSLRGAAAQVFADLQNARMNAVMANHRYRLVVVDAQTYQLHDDANNNSIEDAGETVLTRTLEMDSPHVIFAALSTITFAADGTAPTSGTITVSYERDSARSLNVLVSPAGRVRIEQPAA